MEYENIACITCGILVRVQGEQKLKPEQVKELEFRMECMPCLKKKLMVKDGK